MREMSPGRLAAGIAVIMACSGCAPVAGQPGSGGSGEPRKGRMQMAETIPAPGDVVSGEGRLADGVECPVILAQGGGLYAIAGGVARGDLPPPETRVRFVGTVLDSSICMQGTPLHIDRLDPLAD